MGNQPDKPLDERTKPLANNQTPDLIGSSSTSMGLSPDFGSFSLPEFSQAYNSISNEMPSFSNSLSQFQQKTKQITSKVGKEFEIGIGATIIDINGFVNDISKIDKRLYFQNYSAGAALLYRYQQNLALISDRNKQIHAKADLSSEKMNKIILSSFSSHSDWQQLSTQLDLLPSLIENINQAKAKLNSLFGKLEQAEAILMADTGKVLDFPLQLIREDQTKQLENLKYANKLQLAQLANNLEQRKRNNAMQDEREKIDKLIKEEMLKTQQERTMMIQKKQTLLNQYEKQKEDFEIYGQVGSPGQQSLNGESSKLEDITLSDIKIDSNVDDELDSFFSTKKVIDNTEEINENENELEEENKITYLDDEEPDWK